MTDPRQKGKEYESWQELTCECHCYMNNGHKLKINQKKTRPGRIISQNSAPDLS